MPNCLPPQGSPTAPSGRRTIAAGALLLLISFTTNYGNDNLFHFGTLPSFV
jgi:hypothetical protein